MAKIDELLNKISTATYGKDARQSIYEALRICIDGCVTPGYYKPMISKDGTLSWVASGDWMPEIESTIGFLPILSKNTTSYKLTTFYLSGFSEDPDSGDCYVGLTFADGSTKALLEDDFVATGNTITTDWGEEVDEYAYTIPNNVVRITFIGNGTIPEVTMGGEYVSDPSDVVPTADIFFWFS